MTARGCASTTRCRSLQRARGERRCVPVRAQGVRGDRPRTRRTRSGMRASPRTSASTGDSGSQSQGGVLADAQRITLEHARRGERRARGGCAAEARVGAGPCCATGALSRVGLEGGGLVDEYSLFVHPTALGAGVPFFRRRVELKLVDVRRFDTGVVALRYSTQLRD